MLFQKFFENLALKFCKVFQKVFKGILSRLTDEIIKHQRTFLELLHFVENLSIEVL